MNSSINPSYSFEDRERVDSMQLRIGVGDGGFQIFLNKILKGIGQINPGFGQRQAEGSVNRRSSGRIGKDG